MKTYHFLVRLGNIKLTIDIEARSEKQAIKIIQKEYPSEDGYSYILL